MAFFFLLFFLFDCPFRLGDDDDDDKKQGVLDREKGGKDTIVSSLLTEEYFTSMITSSDSFRYVCLPIYPSFWKVAMQSLSRGIVDLC